MGIGKFGVIGLLVCFVLVGCSKYEEGPMLSLRFKNTRLDGFWIVEKYQMTDVNTGEVTDAIAEGWINDKKAYVEFNKGGVYNFVNPDGFGTESGVYIIESGRGKNYMTIQRHSEWGEIKYYIKKLSNDHVKYYYIDEHPDDPNRKVKFEINLIPKVI